MKYLLSFSLIYLISCSGIKKEASSNEDLEKRQAGVSVSDPGTITSGGPKITIVAMKDSQRESLPINVNISMKGAGKKGETLGIFVYKVFPKSGSRKLLAESIIDKVNLPQEVTISLLKKRENRLFGHYEIEAVVGKNPKVISKGDKYGILKLKNDQKVYSGQNFSLEINQTKE